MRGIRNTPGVAHVVVVAPDSALEESRRAAEGGLDGATLQLTVVAGGAQRADSVAAGLRALPRDIGIVLVHDAARALAPPEVFSRVVAAVRHGHAAVVPGLPVVDTVKQVTAREVVSATLDRTSLRAVQTPQGFLRETLERAHATQRGATDDAGMVESMGGQVVVVPGHERGMKITTPADLDRAATWLSPQPAPGAPVLVVLAGLPGVGKTTLARLLSARLGAAHLRVDTVEVALERAGMEQIGPAGYAVLYEVAVDQLAVGRPVVADTVNPWTLTRQAWAQVAARGGARLLQVEVQCSDEGEHRRRVEHRTSDIDGHQLPSWRASSQRDYTPWVEAELRLDTAAADPDALVEVIVTALASGDD